MNPSNPNEQQDNQNPVESAPPFDGATSTDSQATQSGQTDMVPQNSAIDTTDDSSATPLSDTISQTSESSSETETSNVGQNFSPAPTEDQQPQSTSSPEFNQPGAAAVSAPESIAPQKKSRKKLFIALTCIVVGILLLVGGGAAAYFGYVVPNKPETVLKNATFATLQSEQITFDGELSVKSDEEFGTARLEFLSKSDMTSGESDTTMALVIAGAEIQFDVRAIEDDLYIKVGDLTTIESLISIALGSEGFSDEQTAQISSLVDQTSDVIANQWILIDSTLLNQASPDCSVTESFSFTEADLTLLEDQFVANPFITINETSNETVNDIATKKFDLTIDNVKGAAYANSLNNLSFVKTLEKCSESISEYDQEVESDQLLQDGTTEMTVWVDTTADRLHKISIGSITLEGEPDTTVSGDVVMGYGAFSVEVPDDTRPAIDVLADLQGVFYGGNDVLGLSTLFPNVDDTNTNGEL